MAVAFIEVVAIDCGSRYLIPVSEILFVKELDAGRTKIEWGRAGYSMVLKDRYEDVLKFIRQAGGVIANRPEDNSGRQVLS